MLTFPLLLCILDFDRSLTIIRGGKPEKGALADLFSKHFPFGFRGLAHGHTRGATSNDGLGQRALKVDEAEASVAWSLWGKRRAVPA